MKISDETLMAFADGELDAAARAAVETAMREDPQIAERVAQHRALRQRIHMAYSAELAEQVPERLVAAARGAARPQVSKVVDIKDAREASGRDALRARAPRSWRQPAASIAASLIVGVGLGYSVLRHAEPFARTAAGALVARGQLANALSNQLAAEQAAGSAVQIGLSFVAKSGVYCRTFALSGAVSPSGLACRHGREWQIETLTQSAHGAIDGSGYRTAASSMAPAILSAVQEQIAGEPLDQAGESAALRRDWMPADR